MRTVSASEALEFVANADLPPRPRGGLELEAVGAASMTALDAAKNQAAVVGSDILSFVQGVTPERRRVLINSSLLAQLVASKRVPDQRRIYDWYSAYFDVLANIGWAIQDRGFATYREYSEGFDAHEAILQVAATLLGPAPAALAVVMSTLNALKSMSDGNPWFTLYNRESQRGEAARFQIALAESGADDAFMVWLMAFGLEAQATVTQVAFFRFESSEATLSHMSGRVTIGTDTMPQVAEAIAQKVAAYQLDYVKSLPDLD